MKESILSSANTAAMNKILAEVVHYLAISPSPRRTLPPLLETPMQNKKDFGLLHNLTKLENEIAVAVREASGLVNNVRSGLHLGSLSMVKAELLLEQVEQLLSRLAN